MTVLLERAAICGSTGEVPVAAVILDQHGRCIGHGRNRREHQQDPLGHAELIALRQAALVQGDWRFNSCTLIATLEPCTMCAGALVHARIRKLHFATLEPRSGAIISSARVLDNSSLNHHVMYQHGLYAEQCASLMRDFFSAKR